MLHPSSARLSRIVAALVLPALGACSLVFATDELSNGATGAGGGSGSAAATTSSAGGAKSSSSTATSASGVGGKPACAGAADCDDLNPCTSDACVQGTCAHVVMQGAACGQGTDCTPAPACDAQGKCVAATPDPTKCDDKNDCTIDTCETAGCKHVPNTGAKCNDGNPCDMIGVCNAQGACVGSPVGTVGECAGNSQCPSGFFASSFSCNAFCGACPLCVNAFTCTFACTPMLEACCGNDCNAACPAGYHVASAPMDSVPCGCSAQAPGKSVICSNQ